MKEGAKALLPGLLLVACSSATLAEDLEGKIDKVDHNELVFVVQGIGFFATTSTDYDGGLKGFDDLKEGQKVEVDFEYSEGKHFAMEVEPAD